jgi:phosphate:Na+ symporter
MSSVPVVLHLFGGVGLFLLGMLLLTDGLKALAGDSLRSALVRFTGTPRKAFVSGTVATLLVQSSSATTVMVIGFVSAGLLTFPQALGVVFGASLGTTGTGWIVSLLGLKISLGSYALPMVAAGAFARLLGRGWVRSGGMAFAGFGLIFLGIDGLQQAMTDLAEVVPLADLPSRGFFGHLLAMLIGILLTVIMQSSSAAVATTLTALHSQVINFEQASSLVIGAAIGTTITAVLASLGANTPARRTALAFVIFNLATGVIALILLPGWLWLLGWAQRLDWLEPGATSLAAFHTLFIAFGVVLFLPVVEPFARFIEKILPERGSLLTKNLDRSVLGTPTVALEVSGRALREIVGGMLARLGPLLREGSKPEAKAAEDYESALKEVRRFLLGILPGEENAELSQEKLTQLHAVDHLLRLAGRLNPRPEVRGALAEPALAEAADLTRAVIATGEALPGLSAGEVPASLEKLEKLSRRLAEVRRLGRERVLVESVGSAASATDPLRQLDALRWFDRVGYHLWRAFLHLWRTEPAALSEPEEDSA